MSACCIGLLDNMKVDSGSIKQQTVWIIKAMNCNELRVDHIKLKLRSSWQNIQTSIKESLILLQNHSRINKFLNNIIN